MGIFLDAHELECLYSLVGPSDLIDYNKVLGTLDRISALQPADAAGVPSQHGILRNSHRMLGHHLRTKLLRDTLRSHVAQYCESKNKSLGVLTTHIYQLAIVPHSLCGSTFQLLAWGCQSGLSVL